MSDFTHLNAAGDARMVDVGQKGVTHREARAEALVTMQAETLKAIAEQRVKKGDVLAVCRIAGIMAAKKTSDLIPLCHILPLDGVDIALELEPEQNQIRIQSTVRNHGKTGVEMEALTAASIAALTLYDMCKSMDRGMCVKSIRLLQKSGGKSGDYQAEDSAT